jgi:hypothetical protein
MMRMFYAVRLQLATLQKQKRPQQCYGRFQNLGT